MAQISPLPLYRRFTSPIQTEFPFKGRPTLRSIALSRRFRILCPFLLLLLLVNHVFTNRITGGRPKLEIVVQENSIHRGAAEAGTTDWSRFAYVQYVTNTAYLCNAVMIFESLHRLGSKADRLMLVPTRFTDGRYQEKRDQLIEKARREYGVKVEFVKIQRRGPDGTWGDSFTKLLAFNQTQYDRVLSLDSDSTVLQPMDELFLLPSTPIAMPKAYWLPDSHFSSQVILLEPSTEEFSKILTAIKRPQKGEFDMEILNKLYGRTATALPHRIYDMITGEVRSNDHSKFLDGKDEQWDLEKVLKAVKFIHFSDWPMPKPWYNAPADVKLEAEPKCVEGVDKGLGGQGADCRARDAWLGFYEDFRVRRKSVCKMDYRTVNFGF